MKKEGFTLLELSVAIAAIGLLAGAVIAGESLARASDLRSVLTDSSTYTIAVNSFREKYAVVPGDMPNATAMWGILAGSNGNDASCQDTEAVTNATCNGDGDGIIATSDPLRGGNGVTDGERLRAWQHLSNAGFIPGQYTGRTDSATSGSFVIAPGKNVPAGAVKNSHFRFVGIAVATSGSSTDFDGKPRGNYLEFRTLGGSLAPLSPEEAYSMDVKTDDGKPGLGSMTTKKNSSPEWGNCSSTDDRFTALYRVNDGNKRCVFDLRAN